MSALEESLRKVYGLVGPQAATTTSQMAKKAMQPATPGATPNLQMQLLPETIRPGAMSDLEMQLLPETIIPGATPDLQMQLFEGAENMSEEDRETLESMLQRAEQVSMAPLGQIAQELAMQGEGDDTQLAHLRPGEVVLPPEFFEDEQFESAVEKKFNELGLNPEEAIVGTGIASLNPVTGLEQFGFFKKIGKALKKVAKKIAPVAGPLANFIPGVGPVLAGAIGAATNVAAGKGLKGAITGGLSGFGTGKLFSGVGSLGSVGGKLVGKGGFSQLGTLDKFRALGSGLRSGNLASTFFNPATGDKGILGGQFGPNLRRGIGSFTGFGQTPQQQPGFDMMSSQRDPETGMFVDQFGNSVDPATYRQYLSDPSSIPTGGLGNMILGGGQQQAGGNLISRLIGGGQGQGGGFGSGLGDALKLGGIGALAAGLGKLAYEDAQKQKGVPLTPLTTMSPTGRYNIEAEIARRMGQPEPNPVEFGLLPAGTIPELSGGKPRGMQEGGSVNKMRGLAIRAGQANNIINELETTFNPNNMRDLLASNLPFDPTAIENLLTSAEKKQYDRAKLDFTTSILRKETGAVINDSEIDYIDRTFFPQLGDDEEIVMQKRQARQQVIQSLMPEEKSKSKDIVPMQMMMYGGGVEDLTGGMVRGLASGGGVMAFAQGGAVQMQEGGGIATLSQENINSYIKDLSKKRQLVGNLYMKKPSRFELQFKNATNNLQNAKLYLTPSNIAKFEEGGIDSLKDVDAKKEMNKFLKYMETQKMQKGGEMNPSQFPRMDGDINGPGTETSDDIPAMLSDGEFVMTGRAVRGAGSYEMQADPSGIISLTPTLKEDRERGMDLMYKMMDTFAGKAKAS